MKTVNTRAPAYLASSIFTMVFLVGFYWLERILRYQANTTFDTSWIFLLMACYGVFAVAVALSFNWQFGVSPAIRLIVEMLRAAVAIAFPLLMGLYFQNMLYLICAALFATNLVFSLVVYLRWQTIKQK